MEELKFVVTCNYRIKGIITNCETREQAFNKFLLCRGIDKSNVKNILDNKYEPFYRTFEYEGEFYTLDGFYFDIL